MSRAPSIACVALAIVFGGMTVANILGIVTVEQSRQFLFYTLPPFGLLVLAVFFLARRAERS